MAFWLACLNGMGTWYFGGIFFSLGWLCSRTCVFVSIFLYRDGVLGVLGIGGGVFVT